MTKSFSWIKDVPKDDILALIDDKIDLFAYQKAHLINQYLDAYYNFVKEKPKKWTNYLFGTPSGLMKVKVNSKAEFLKQLLDQNWSCDHLPTYFHWEIEFLWDRILKWGNEEIERLVDLEEAALYAKEHNLELNLSVKDYNLISNPSYNYGWMPYICVETHSIEWRNENVD